jgi:mannose-6-phosphate isomerase-like protein (cupin superfamily)
MERRDFLMNSALLTAFAGLSQNTFGQPSNVALSDTIKPVLLPALPPLDHKGSSDIRVWIRTSMTNGLFSSVECAVAPKTMGPAPHWHKELDELMFVLEGTASVLVGDEVVQIEAGGWHLRPRMIKHTFFNASDKPLRFVDMYFNQPFEEFLEKIFHQLTPENGFPRGSAALSREREVLNEKFGLFYPSTAGEERAAIVKKYGLQ